jgi:hypothetical protein
MKSIPSGHVSTPKSTIPPAAHGLLSSIFARLAAHHAQLANSPDPAVARLPRPDQAARDVQGGYPLLRRPVIGVPNSPIGVPNSPY